jgi:hypothetical protein
MNRSDTRSREEVMNVLLAEYINDSGMSAEAENVEQSGAGRRALPDVIISFQGLRCSIEGKWADVNNARDVVSRQARERIQTGIAHIALAVTYPAALKGVPLSDKKQELQTARLYYCLFTELTDGTWREGNVDAINDDVRRARQFMATDDVVVQAVSELQKGMSGLVSVLTNNPAACDRLADILCVYEKEKSNQEEYEDED